MNEIQCPSLHVFSDNDMIVPPEKSMEVMSLYLNPKMLCISNSSDHDIPADVEIIDYVANHVETIYNKKHKINQIILED